MIHVVPVGSGKKRFSKCLIFRKTAFFYEHCVSVNQQSQYTIRNLISKLAPNWPGGGGDFEVFLFGGRNSPIKKLPGGMVRLGID